MDVTPHPLHRQINSVIRRPLLFLLLKNYQQIISYLASSSAQIKTPLNSQRRPHPLHRQINSVIRRPLLFLLLKNYQQIISYLASSSAQIKTPLNSQRRSRKRVMLYVRLACGQICTNLECPFWDSPSYSINDTSMLLKRRPKVALWMKEET